MSNRASIIRMAVVVMHVGRVVSWDLVSYDGEDARVECLVERPWDLMDTPPIWELLHARVDGLDEI